MAKAAFSSWRKRLAGGGDGGGSGGGGGDGGSGGGSNSRRSSFYDAINCQCSMFRVKKCGGISGITKILK